MLSFDFFSPPPLESLRAALELLHDLGACGIWRGYGCFVVLMRQSN
jgi:hypothetical protein